MRFYKDAKNCIWFPDNAKYEYDYYALSQERKFLRLLIDSCIDRYDPFEVFNAFCLSDCGNRISQFNHTGYFYGVGRLLEDFRHANILKTRKMDWDVVVFHWVIDIYIEARSLYHATYRELACKYPVFDVYHSFNPLHETSESNALEKMCFHTDNLIGCMINDAYYYRDSEIPQNELYLLKHDQDAVYCAVDFINSAIFLPEDFIDLDLFSEISTCRDLAEVLRYDRKVRTLINRANTSTFVYCSMDTKLGIGLDYSDFRRINKMQWRGQNLLGFALQEVYNDLSR